MTGFRNDTIAAVSTSLTPSGIGIVRISGPEAFAVGDRVFRAGRAVGTDDGQKAGTEAGQKAGTEAGQKAGTEAGQKAASPAALAEAPANTVLYGHIMDGGEPVDEVLVTVLRAPHSYTAEDTVEINCHGGPHVL
ncbi:MAG: hypothetical protein IIZ51_05970, partial [Lachnospiraceae bacterium]|nr:hypothetical protein [Lachnospiraceae bacterium]